MTPRSQGVGALFADPSAERARAFFAAKPRGRVDKLTTVAEAVARLVADEEYLAIGGFGCDRIPTPVVHRIVRQGPRRLRFARDTAAPHFQPLCPRHPLGRGQPLAA